MSELYSLSEGQGFDLAHIRAIHGNLSPDMDFDDMLQHLALPPGRVAQYVNEKSLISSVEGNVLFQLLDPFPRGDEQLRRYKEDMWFRTGGPAKEWYTYLGHLMRVPKVRKGFKVDLRDCHRSMLDPDGGYLAIPGMQTVVYALAQGMAHKLLEFHAENGTLMIQADKYHVAMAKIIRVIIPGDIAER